MNNNKVILCCEHLGKTFRAGRLHVDVLKNVNFTAKLAETIAILGPSGSGKSTLLHLLGGLNRPSTGRVYLDGHDIHALSEAKRCQLRNRALGFVYQFHHLLPEFSALENVAMPLLLNTAANEARQQAAAMLKQVGLAKRLAHRVGELSGGECQRVAIARALINRPLCLIADEPTGNLDSYNAHAVFELLQQLNQECLTTLIIVSHDLNLASKMQRILTIDAGHLVE